MLAQLNVELGCGVLPMEWWNKVGVKEVIIVLMLILPEKLNVEMAIIVQLIMKCIQPHVHTVSIAMVQHIGKELLAGRDFTVQM